MQITCADHGLEFQTEFEQLKAAAKQEFHQDAPATLDRTRRERALTTRAVRRRWGTALDAYDLTLNYVLRIGHDFTTAHPLDPDPARDPVGNALSRLHTKACVVASDVRALIATGHGGGAIARWRTLHEVAVTARFIFDHGHDVALRYHQHYIIEEVNLLNEIRRSTDASGEESVTPEVMAHRNKRRNQLIQQWGSAFASQYGWAADALGTDRPTFAALERAIGADVHSRWLYRIASFAVHAHVAGLDMALPFIDTKDMLLMGSSVEGLATSGSSALRALLSCTTDLVRIHSDQQLIFRLAVLMDLVAEAEAAFEKADFLDDPDSYQQVMDKLHADFHRADN